MSPAFSGSAIPANSSTIYEKLPGNKRSEWWIHFIVCRGEHVIAENFVNKRIGNKNINNDRYDCKNFKKKREISDNFVQVDLEGSKSTAKVAG
jgi:hypothetical protein